MVDRIRYPTVSYLPFYFIFFLLFFFFFFFFLLFFLYLLAGMPSVRCHCNRSCYWFYASPLWFFVDFPLPLASSDSYPFFKLLPAHNEMPSLYAAAFYETNPICVCHSLGNRKVDWAETVSNFFLRRIYLGLMMYADSSWQ